MSWWSHSGSLALLYNKETRITEAVFHSESNLLGFQLLKNIKKNAVDWTNPLSIALEVIQMVVAFFHSELEKLQQKLGRINEQTGQHNYANIPPTDPFKLDFLATTRSLNTLSQDAILMTATFTSLINVLDNLQKFKKATEDLEEDGHGCIEAIKIDERMDILRENCRSLLIEVKSLNKQSAVLIQVEYQFMAQKDAKVNIELAKSSTAIAKASKEDSAIMLELAKTSAAIAKSNKEDSMVMIELAKSSADIAKASKEDSAVMIELGKSSAAIAKSSKEDSAAMKTIAIETKRDSAAMKTMSILGMLFLPGTFIATVFSMPVFDWEEDGTPIMKPAFRYYWAVTLPLTLGILLAWSVTMVFPGKWAARWWKKAPVVKDLQEDSGSTAS
ncbi:uncharacterized protein PAC_17060 [Phialocephala subalpina]|uniref:Uncharacterized protein n=1 Tax=Phialocephala subalpina TaxID=576137 RepID=A0A1L7XQ40_9HELO|nr:uncharacterized protein PAC_17060 [Phialocephala subalpina]